MASATNGHATDGISPKITLYTNHGCPWAHRAHITLKELNLPYEEVIIDLAQPREPWYLKINPRGLVPSLTYSNTLLTTTLTESGIVSQFLADSFPSHLLPASHASPTAPLTRAKVAFFVDTFVTKVSPKISDALKAEGEKERAEIEEAIVGNLEREIEPLLASKREGDGVFLEGRERMTLAEALTAPFILRLHAYSKAGLLSPKIDTRLQALPNYKKWMEALLKEESVTYIWEEETHIEKVKAVIEKLRAEKEKGKEKAGEK